MKKRFTFLSVLTVVLMFVSLRNASAQACFADTVRYRDSTAGVFPLPYDAALSPTGGISRVACQTRPYRFVFTVKVAETITFNGIQLPLDSVVMQRTGAVTGMPLGLSYACNPPNCSFKQRTYGCVLISGTPTTANALQDYALTIAGTAHVSGVGPLNLTFPGLVFPGEYKIKLVAANSAQCPANTGAEELKDKITDMKVVPNPVDGRATFVIDSETTGDFVVKIYDMTGRILQKEVKNMQLGENRVDFDASSMSNGVYLLQLSQGDAMLTKRFVVQH